MKKIIPFKKQFTFKTNVSEITSISLENSLQNRNTEIEGELVISGTYKITETSIQVEQFEFRIPINIEIDKKYNTENMKIDINDFYYEIINNAIIEVNIEILIDNIVEIMDEQIEKPIEKKIIDINNIKQERCIEEETIKNDIVQEKEEILVEPTTQKDSIIKNIIEIENQEQDEYSTYHVYIVRENDTIETVLSKYDITREKLTEYNDINEITIGDKIIIPQQNDRN